MSDFLILKVEFRNHGHSLCYFSLTVHMLYAVLSIIYIIKTFVMYQYITKFYYLYHIEP